MRAPLLQPGLFDDGPRILVADAEGGIHYAPGFVDDATAHNWFDRLREDVAWRDIQRPMYERVVDVPRRIASYALDAADLPGALAEAAAHVRRMLPHPFDHVGLNLYRNGRDSVAMHNDRLQDLAPGHSIALVSLGAPRDMLIRPKPGVVGRALRIRLEPGSLLVMSHASQSTHEHGIPKTAEPVGPRISLAFRVRGAALRVSR